jgi:hypothetical protein
MALQQVGHGLHTAGGLMMDDCHVLYSSAAAAA